MKKLLLSFTVMFFLCSVSFAQTKKSAVFSREAKEAKQKELEESEKNKIPAAPSSENQKDISRKSPLQKSDLQKPQSKSKFFIIEPELDAAKAPAPSLRKNVSN
jgi:sortase (surface protein transpeptidase)